MQFVFEVKDVRLRGEHGLVGFESFFLQAHVLVLWRQVRNKVGQRHAALAVILVLGAAAPHQADARFGFLTESGAPFRKVRGVGAEIAATRG